MLENIKACIFDMDGTIIDSMGIWVSIDDEYVKKYHLVLPKDYHEKIGGKNFYETAVYYKEELNVPISVEEIMDEWHKMAYDKYVHEIKFKENFCEFLKHLKKLGIKIGIATSNSRELCTAFLKANDALEYFDFIGTANEIKASKPAPDIYLYVAKNLNVESRDCLVFEDIPNGILAGKNAGMRVCGVFDKYSSEFDEYKRKLSDYYIYNYNDQRLYQR